MMRTNREISNTTRHDADTGGTLCEYPPCADCGMSMGGLMHRTHRLCPVMFPNVVDLEIAGLHIGGKVTP